MNTLQASSPEFQEQRRYKNKGSFAPGKDADIMMFDTGLNLTGVIQMGRPVE